MPNPNNFINQITEEIAVKLAGVFDRNFENKAFFTEPWPATKWNNHRGSMLNRTGALRRSINVKTRNGEIIFTSPLPYANIHNQGGEIKVTPRMKRFFWAMYKKHAGKGKSKTHNREAAIWKSLALMKTGQVIKIPKRQFIGHHWVVDNLVQKLVTRSVKKHLNDLFK